MDAWSKKVAKEVVKGSEILDILLKVKPVGFADRLDVGYEKE